MRNFLILLLALFTTTRLPAQGTFKKNTVYAEVLGNGMVLSLNYEKQLGSKPGFGLHAGIGLGGDKPAFPFGVTYLSGMGKQRSVVEWGAGFTLAERDMWDNKVFITDANPYQVAFIPSVGYRHHTNYGLMWKLIYSPFFTKVRTELAYFGAAIGWRF